MATLSQAQTQLYNLGAGVLQSDSGSATYYLNQAKNWIEDKDNWPWLEATATGSAPLTIADLRNIIYVADSTNDRLLQASTASDIATIDPTLDSTGAPSHYYLDGLTSVKVWPSSTVSLSVRYIKYSPELSAAGDTPLIPTRYHALWIQVAYYLFLQVRQPQSITGDFVTRLTSSIDDMREQFFKRTDSVPNLYGTVGISSATWL